MTAAFAYRFNEVGDAYRRGYRGLSEQAESDMIREKRIAKREGTDKPLPFVRESIWGQFERSPDYLTVSYTFLSVTVDRYG